MRRLLIASLFLAAISCKDKPAPASQQTSATTCVTSEDCGEGEICLGGECADPSQKALLTDPGNVVTPDKVQKEVDAINQAHEAQVDKALDY